MGCGSSVSRDVQTLHRNVEKKTKQVQIEKGSNANLRADNDNIIFLFGEPKYNLNWHCHGNIAIGGPGSGKGKIISELLEEQNITAELISTQLLILDQLPHKVSNAIKLHSTKDVTGELISHCLPSINNNH